MASEDSFTKQITVLLNRVFKKEIEEEARLEAKYNLSHTKDEMERRRILQDRNKYYNLKAQKYGFFSCLRSTWKWFRKYYFSLKPRETLDMNNYAKHVRKTFAYLFFLNMVKSSFLSLGIFFMMRLVKHRGSKDLRYISMWTVLIAAAVSESNCHMFVTQLKLPMNTKDLERRKEILEHYVFTMNRCEVLKNQLKYISKNYFPDRVELNFITPTTGQNILFSLAGGRLYVSTDNYAETFGFTSEKGFFARINRLNVDSIRERDVIFGMFSLYDKMIEKFKEKYDIKEKKEVETKLLQKIIDKHGLSKDQVQQLQGAEILSEVDFSKLETHKANEKKEENSDKKNRYYL